MRTLVADELVTVGDAEGAPPIALGALTLTFKVPVPGALVFDVPGIRALVAGMVVAEGFVATEVDSARSCRA
jgi:hypothetical protein